MTRASRSVKGLRRAGAVSAALLAAGLAGLLAVDRWAPPQNLPWKPLDLDQPIGWATHAKLAGLSTDDCRHVLAAGAIRFSVEPPRGPPACAVADGVRLTDGLAAFRPERPLMSCREALAFAIWERHAVQPVARRALGTGVAATLHFGTFNCRAVRGRPQTPSEHSHANAIDVAGFLLDDRRDVSVRRDWKDPGSRGRFLHDVRAAACRVFGHTLSPDFNADHRDHFHLDMSAWGGPWGGCA